MYETIELFPGIDLHCITTGRFKQGLISVQLLRPMQMQEAACNALIPEILLRGCATAPDIQQITARLDDLYGATVGAQVRRIGDWQTTGLACGFIDDRFALSGDRVLAPMSAFLTQLLLRPVLQEGVFCTDFVRSEKKNLISALQAQKNDKQAYATAKLLENMCRGDSFAVPRLGRIAQVRRITPQSAYAHYQAILQQSHISVFYVGSADAARVADMLRPAFADLPRNVRPLPQTEEFVPAAPSHRTQRQKITQGKLAMGFVTPLRYDSVLYPAMKLLEQIFGGGMNAKLFTNVREKEGLCYAIGSAYYGSKGILTVQAGIDTAHFAQTRDAVLRQLSACCNGEISERELTAAREGVRSALRAVYDSPGAMESYFFASAYGGLTWTPEQYAEKLAAVTLDDVVAAANTLHYHSDFFLKGDDRG